MSNRLPSAACSAPRGGHGARRRREWRTRGGVAFSSQREKQIATLAWQFASWGWGMEDTVPARVLYLRAHGCLLCLFLGVSSQRESPFCPGWRRTKRSHLGYDTDHDALDRWGSVSRRMCHSALVP